MARDDIVSPPEEEGNLVETNLAAPTFSIDELLAELRPREDGGGWTIEELCEQSGHIATTTNRQKISRKIRDLRKEGLWEYSGEKYIWYEAMKSERPVPTYRPVAQEGIR